MRKWIVLVDDDLDMHYIYQKVFEKLKLGDSIKLFENGKDALGYLRAFPEEVKIIFSDINMPVMDGLQFRKAITDESNPACATIPFIFFSTSAQDREVKAANELMVQGFFQKGLTIREIETSIGTVLSYWGKCTTPEFSDSIF